MFLTKKEKILLLFRKYQEMNVDIKILYSKIKVVGPLGVVERNFEKNKYCFLLLSSGILKQNSFLLSNKFYNLFFNDFFKMLVGVTTGWYFCFNIFGRGFSFRLKKKNTNLYLKLKVGYSHFVYYKLDKQIFVKISKKRNKLFIFGLNFWLVYKIAHQLRNLRSKHTYKIQGILFLNEKIIVKPGKKKQS